MKNPLARLHALRHKLLKQAELMAQQANHEHVAASSAYAALAETPQCIAAGVLAQQDVLLEAARVGLSCSATRLQAQQNALQTRAIEHKQIETLRDHEAAAQQQRALRQENEVVETWLRGRWGDK